MSKVRSTVVGNKTGIPTQGKRKQKMAIKKLRSGFCGTFPVYFWKKRGAKAFQADDACYNMFKHWGVYLELCFAVDKAEVFGTLQRFRAKSKTHTTFLLDWRAGCIAAAEWLTENTDM
jgi:hypothetical protein